MDIREALLAEHSKRQTMKIVRYIGGDPVRFRELMSLFLGDTYRVTQRAAWAVNYCAEQHHELVRPYFGKLVVVLERGDAHVAVLRNVARMLQFVDIPGRYHSRVYDACLGLVDDPLQPVAVRCFSMNVAARIAEGKPALINELRLVIEKHSANLSPGLLVRARQLASADAD
jgi:hypothetical protein